MNIRKALPEDVNAILELTRRRIRWMDEKGLNHWNKLDYFAVYPELYFRENINSFIIAEQEGQLIGALAVFDYDSFWQDTTPALYLHNFVAEAECPGTGAALLHFAEKMALARGISRMRMDTNLKAHALSAYYEAKGYRARGLVQDGPYFGVLREKLLDRENPPYDGAGFFDLGNLQEEDFQLRLEKTAAADPVQGWVPAYHFAICSPEGEKMGNCDLRIGHNERLYYGGHIGYQVEEAFRGRHLAARAVRLLLLLAEKHGLGYGLITCHPENMASRRTAEWAGFRLLETASVPAWHDLARDGSTHACIFAYSLELRRNLNGH